MFAIMSGRRSRSGNDRTRQRVSEDGDDDRVTKSDLRNILNEVLAPLTKNIEGMSSRMEALEKANAQLTVNTAEVKDRVASFDASLLDHGRRLSSVEGKLKTMEGAGGIPPRASSGPAGSTPTPPGATPRAASPRRSGGGTASNKAPGNGSSVQGNGSSMVSARIEFVGMHDYERRMDEALDSAQAKTYLKKLYASLSPAVRDLLTPWETIEKDVSNNRALVFVPVMMLRKECDVHDRERVLAALRDLLRTGAHDVNGRTPRVRGPVPEHLRVMNKLLARNHQLVRILCERFGLRQGHFKVQPAGQAAEVWGVLGRPRKLWSVDCDNLLFGIAHSESIHEGCTEALVRESWAKVLNSSS